MVQHHHLRHGDGMTQITFQDGKVVLRDGRVGTEQACCCAAGPCCVCGEILLRHVAADSGSLYGYYWGPGGAVVGIAPTEQDALDAQSDHIAAIGWGRPVQFGGAGGDGVSFADAADALADYGCGDTQVYDADPPFYINDGVIDGWIAPLPYIIVRCCGKVQPDEMYTNAPCGGGGAPNCILTPGYIETWPWVHSTNFEVLWPCVDDGSNVVCSETPCAAGDPCARGSCTSDPQYEGDPTPCQHLYNPLP